MSFRPFLGQAGGNLREMDCEGHTALSWLAVHGKLALLREMAQNEAQQPLSVDRHGTAPNAPMVPDASIFGSW